MKIFLIAIISLIGRQLNGAGGVPLEQTNDILLKTQLIKDEQAAIQRQIEWQKTMAKVIPVTNEPYDPEYIAILEDFDRRKEAFELSHRDLQWHIVAKTMTEIDDIDERLGLIDTVRHNPLWRQLPPTVAITSINLKNWNVCRKLFYEHLKRLRK